MGVGRGSGWVAWGDNHAVSDCLIRHMAVWLGEARPCCSRSTQANCAGTISPGMGEPLQENTVTKAYPLKAVKAFVERGLLAHMF